MGFFRHEYWSGLPCPPPGDLPDPGIEPASPVSPALASRFFTFCVGSLTGLHTFTEAPSWRYPSSVAFPHLAAAESGVGLVLQGIITNSTRAPCCLKSQALVLIPFKPSVWVGIFASLRACYLNMCLLTWWKRFNKEKWTEVHIGC